MKNSWKVIKHSLIEHYLTIIRNKKSNNRDFVEAVKKITYLTLYPVTAHLKTKEVQTTTPFVQTTTKQLTGEVIICPVLRAGLSMADIYQQFIENVKVGHILIQREKAGQATREYYFKMPDLNQKEEKKIIILEPMIATGQTLEKTIEKIKAGGKVKNEEITIVSLIISQYAQAQIEKKYQNLTFFIVKIDPQLNTKNYIVPGFGDAGDRFFNTE